MTYGKKYSQHPDNGKADPLRHSVVKTLPVENPEASIKPISITHFKNHTSGDGEAESLTPSQRETDNSTNDLIVATAPTKHRRLFEWGEPVSNRSPPGTKPPMGHQLKQNSDQSIQYRSGPTKSKSRTVKEPKAEGAIPTIFSTNESAQSITCNSKLNNGSVGSLGVTIGEAPMNKKPSKNANSISISEKAHERSETTKSKDQSLQHRRTKHSYEHHNIIGTHKVR